MLLAVINAATHCGLQIELRPMVEPVSLGAVLKCGHLLFTVVQQVNGAAMGRDGLALAWHPARLKAPDRWEVLMVGSQICQGHPRVHVRVCLR